WVLGQGLQFASVVALTVSFGLGLSATIHFLNRLRLEMKPGVSPELAVERATVLVGPALILTTVVLACGLVVTVFSDLPSLRRFAASGWLQIPMPRRTPRSGRRRRYPGDCRKYSGFSRSSCRKCGRPGWSPRCSNRIYSCRWRNADFASDRARCR